MLFICFDGPHLKLSTAGLSFVYQHCNLNTKRPDSALSDYKDRVGELSDASGSLDVLY